ncbi:MAG: hypothetical protein LBL27_02585 [Coriobacteriales bacterium]|jgi:lysophospholipase L1-like esterase|nr:hypothetical protein [Coriobacteriales bacterium]
MKRLKNGATTWLSFVLALALLSFGGAQALTDEPSSGQSGVDPRADGAAFKTKVICVGDSITYGLYVASSGAYPYQLQSKLGDDYAVANYGVSGSTAGTGTDNS